MRIVSVISAECVYNLDPFKVIKTGPGHEIQGDPMKPLEAELAKYRYVQIPQVQTFTGECNPP